MTACKMCGKDPTRCKCEMPKDLGIKIGTKEEVFWTDAKDKLENRIMTMTETVLADKVQLKLADKRIAEEKEKFK